MLRCFPKNTSYWSSRISCLSNSNYFSNIRINQFNVAHKLNGILEITGEKDFSKRVMNSNLPVVVNFHADWCEPCHALRPLLRKIVEDNADKIHLAEITVDDHADLIRTFEVTAVPAVIGIFEGQVVDKFIGLVTDKEVEKFVYSLLNNEGDR